MKLKKVTINNLHNVKYAEYDFTSPLTYFYGPNGAGKSTVLNAIQLGLLGYIPGTAKTNASIMKHSSAPQMTVQLELEDNGQSYEITRTWSKSKTSVKAELFTKPDAFDIAATISSIELPIFNFNEFATMTSNKLKDWFIEMLDSSDDKCDLGAELSNAIKDIGDLLDADYINNLKSSIVSSNSGDVDSLRRITTQLKEELSVKKAELSRAEASIGNLIYHETTETRSIDEVNAAIAEVNQEYAAKVAEVEKAKHILGLYDRLSQQGSADKISSELETAQTEYDLLVAKMRILDTDLEQANKDYAKSVQAYEANQAVMSAGSVCAITKQPCSQAATVIFEAKNNAINLQAEMSHLKTICDQKSQDKVSLQSAIYAALDIVSARKSALNSIERITAELAAASNMSKEYAQLIVDNSEAELTAIVDKKVELNDILTTLKANKKYKEFIDTLVAEKFAIAQDIEILKIWVSLCDVNGLQTRITNNAFNRLSDSITTMLRRLFDDDTIEAQFNLTEKANSFSFGMIRSKGYVEYETLSSGEKCLYALALMMTLIKNSSPALPIILIDDMLDHLDTDRATSLFESLYKIANHPIGQEFQIILAGVQTCNHSAKGEFQVNVSVT